MEIERLSSEYLLSKKLFMTTFQIYYLHMHPIFMLNRDFTIKHKVLKESTVERIMNINLLFIALSITLAQKVER